MTDVNSGSTAKKKCCGHCAYYMTNMDAEGNLSDFHHDRNMSEGFCIIRDLFYTVWHDERACTDWMGDDTIP